MPTNFRAYCGDNQRLQYADLDTYLLLYPPIEQHALMNNIRAARWSLGYVPGVHDLFLSSGVGIECVNVLADTIKNINWRQGSGD